MTEPGKGLLLRIYLDEADRRGKVPLYEWLVREALEKGLAGATVIRGVEGFGSHRSPGIAANVRLSESLPLVVEIVDTEEAVSDFMETVQSVVEEGCAVTQKVKFYHYGKEP